MSKIAIVRLSALGDVITASSFVPYLHSLLDHEFHFFIDENHAQILKHQSFCQVHSLPLKKSLKERNFKALKEIYSYIKSMSFDLSIDMQGILKSGVISRIIPSKKTFGFDRISIRERAAALFYTHKVSIPYSEHIMRRNAKILTHALDLSIPLDCFLESSQLFSKDMFCHSKGARDKAKALIPALDSKKVLLLLGASVYKKAYGLENLKVLTREILALNYRVYTLSFSIDDKAQELRALGAINLWGLNLDEIKALYSELDLVIGGDTGLAHLAYFLRCPSITLYGSTNPARIALSSAINTHIYSLDSKNSTDINAIEPSLIVRRARFILDNLESLREIERLKDEMTIKNMQRARF